MAAATDSVTSDNLESEHNGSQSASPVAPIHKQLDEQLHHILMDFRNAIQRDRDRLYETRDANIDGIKIAHNTAHAQISDLINQKIETTYERGYKDGQENMRSK